MDPAASITLCEDENKSLPPHGYKPLPKRKSIRILQLEPGRSEDPIRCSLIFGHLDVKDLSYEAISYTWGDEKSLRPIICDGAYREIRQNLYQALLVVRDPENTRNLWADALCINQEDDEEKAQQIPLISSIFYKAQGTLICLGAEEDNIVTSAFKEICRYFSGTGAVQDRLRGFLKSGKPSFCMRGKEYRPQLSSLNDRIEPASMNDMIYSNLANLYSCPYFLRGWIIQELIFTISGQVYWGYGKIDMYMVLEYARHFGSFDAQPSSCSEPVSKSLRKCRILMDLRFSPHGLPVVESLCLGRNSHFSYAHDRIYGLIGLSLEDKEGFAYMGRRVNYLLPIENLYRSFAEHFLNTKSRTHVLSGVRHIDEISPSWPSWVPDWRKGPDTRPFRHTLNIQQWKHDSISDPQKSRTEVHAGRLCLPLRCLRVDAVKYVAAKRLSEQSSGRIQQELRELVFRFESDCIALMAVANAVPRKETLESYRQHAHRRCLAFLDQTADIDPREEKSMRSLFLGDLRENLNGRCFMETQRGFLGVGPDITQPGDIIIVLIDSWHPYVIRPAPENLWRLVGECMLDEKYVEHAAEAGVISHGPVEEVLIY